MKKCTGWGKCSEIFYRVVYKDSVITIIIIVFHDLSDVIMSAKDYTDNVWIIKVYVEVKVHFCEVITNG